MNEDHNGVLQCALSINVTRPHLQLETCVQPDVGHVTSYTWHWISIRDQEIVFGCVESVQEVWIPY